jgi:protein-disulfide isomerase
MKIQNIPAIRSVLSGTHLGSAIFCLACLVALLAANNLRVHAGQWAPPESAHDVLAGAGNVNTHMSPETMRSLLSSGNPPELGSHTAPVTIVEFADFECSFCKQMNNLLENQLLPAESGKVKIVYRYFPLPQHPWARSAAQIAACVHLQDENSFWKLDDFLYANQDGFSVSSIRPEIESFLTKQTKVKHKVFESCVDGNTTVAQVDEDIQMATDLGVHATPTLFVNGIQLHGVHELQQLEDAVTSALKDQTTAKLDQ